MPSHHECAQQNFRSAKLYMRLALEEAANGNAEGAYFWRDDMAFPALASALFWRDHIDEVPASFASYRREPADMAAGDQAFVSTRYLVRAEDGTEDALPSIPSDGRDLIQDTGRPAQYETSVEPRTAADADVAFERAAAAVSVPAVTSGLLAMFSKRARTPAAEKKSEESSCKPSMLSVF